MDTQTKIILISLLSCILLSILIGLTIFLFHLRKKRVNQEEVKVTIDDAFINGFIASIGGLKNINQINVLERRVQIVLNNVLLINKPSLLSLNLRASLSGFNLKVLINDDLIDSFQKIKEMHSAL